MTTKITNYNEAIKSLAEWIDDLKEAAKEDQSFSIAWFRGTELYPFAIVGGWVKGIAETYSDLFCMSKSEPGYAMCVKIAVNDGPYAYTDFEAMTLPLDKDGEVEDTCVALEQEDDSESLAAWLLTEWERITKEHEED
jgi:hypothetical protein